MALDKDSNRSITAFKTEQALQQHLLRLESGGYAETSEEILRAAGAEVISTGGRLTVPGRIIHELGTARMGDDPKKSVLNKFNQCWDVKNLFLTDAAPFCSNADKNPTLTIMALAWRASDYLLEELRKGNL